MFSSQSAADVSCVQQQKSCQVVDQTTGQHCCESEALQILRKFEKLYQCKIDKIDDDECATEAQRNELKLKIMTDWVKDLRDQNEMLVQTVHDLEQAAVCRVKLLENKLQETSNIMSCNMSHPDKSEEELNALSSRVCELVGAQDELQERICWLQNDLSNLLELIKRGRLENNWNLDGLTFYEIKSSDIPEPPDCTCGQIANINDNEEGTVVSKELVKKLREELCKLNEDRNITHNIMHELRSKINYLQMSLEKKCEENKDLIARLACLEKESSESREALAAEVAQKHDAIIQYKDKIICLEDKLKGSKTAVKFRDEKIISLKEDLQKALQKVPNTTKKVKIHFEPCEKTEDKTIEDKLHDTTRQLEEFRKLLLLKENEISKLKTVLNEQSNQTLNNKEGKSFPNVSIENQNEIIEYLAKLLTSEEKDKETIQSLKNEYETVLDDLKQTKDMYEKDVSLVNEKLQDIYTCLRSYRTEVLDPDPCNDNKKETMNTKEFIVDIENKISFIQKLVQNECEICVKENVLSNINEIILHVITGIQNLSETYENKSKTISSIQIMITKSGAMCNKNSIKESEQEAIFAAILQQFRMMEEFRLCTVEVQATTEDLREEVSEVISNLNSRHCKYVELTNMISQVQDYLTRTRENITEVISRLELQDVERARHSERIINNRIRLKDLKNDFNQTQSELSKCLNTVQNNIQQTNLLGYSKIHTCNDLLISVVEEVEQIVCNISTFQTQGCCTLSAMAELKKQLSVMEHNVKELKKKSDQVLKENDAAQKSFAQRIQRLDKYECEMDNCHTKMQDCLEHIIAIRDQMNEFGCIKETENSFQSTNETIKMKDDLRKLQKECEELKLKISQETHIVKQDKIVSEWESRVADLQDQIKVLQSEITSKHEANISLIRSIESIEKELASARDKAENYRRCSSTECLELKKRIFKLENSLKVQKDAENNLNCLANNETDSKKSEFLNKDRLCDVTLKHGLQGTYESVPQLFKVLQDTIQAIKNGLEEVSSELKRLVSEGFTHSGSFNESVKTAIDILAKYVERIQHCFIEVEQIKAALYSKDKLMEDMDEIIRIQKDSITISQLEVGELHKKLQEKIDAQESAISQCEKEKRQLVNKIDLQVKTIGHLQDAIVEAKRNIDLLSNKAASDNFNKNQIIRSLNLYLTETQSQYSDCFNEASEQGTLLELQRDSINTLQKKINFLEFDKFFNAFMLHFVYYIVLFKYQAELDLRNQKTVGLKSKIDDLEYEKGCYEKQWQVNQNKYQETNRELERLKCGLEDSRKKLCEKQREVDGLVCENADFKKQLQMYKIDFDLIEEEMKKMGVANTSIENFKVELEAVRLENKKFRCEVEQYKKSINDLKCAKERFTKQLCELKACKDIDEKKFNEKIYRLQCEIKYQKEVIEYLNNRADYAAKIIEDQSAVIEDQERRLNCDENCLKNYSYKLENLKKKYCELRMYSDSLSETLDEKTCLVESLRKENKILQSTNSILKSKIGVLEEQLKHETHTLKNQLKFTECQLQESQRSYKKAAESLMKNQETFINLVTKRRTPVTCPPVLMNTDTCNNCKQLTAQKEDKKLEETVKKLTKDLEELQDKYSKKSAALCEVQEKLNTLSAKLDSSERSCKRQKDEITLLEKKLACEKQKLQNCADKNMEFVCRNKSLEESNNKCMTELEDIVLQLEDMQSSLVELRTQCDAKTQSLECVSVELEKMKVSRSEVCDESKYVLEWVRTWMREQKRIVNQLQDKLYEKQQQLLNISSEKKNFMNAMKKLKRANRVLTRKIKFIRKPITKQTAVTFNYNTLPSQQINKSTVHQNHNGFYSCSRQKVSEAVYSLFKKECKDGSKRTANKITTQGDYAWFPTLSHITKEIPKACQINENIRIEKKTQHEDAADCGYQTSSSK